MAGVVAGRAWRAGCWCAGVVWGWWCGPEAGGRAVWAFQDLAWGLWLGFSPAGAAAEQVLLLWIGPSHVFPDCPVCEARRFAKAAALTRWRNKESLSANG